MRPSPMTAWIPRSWRRISSLALQTIVARNVDPVKQAVVSVTTFETDSTAYNVIPGGVRLKGTVRTHEPAVQDMVEANIAPDRASTRPRPSGPTADAEVPARLSGDGERRDETEFAAEAAQRGRGRMRHRRAARDGGRGFLASC